MKKILKFFDKLEDKTRGFLSHYPMFYAIVGGVAIVIFWRGIWELADIINLSPLWSVIASIIVMMMSGVFVSFFIPDLVILSGIKKEKKIVEKTEAELEVESSLIHKINLRLEKMDKELTEIKNEIQNRK